MTKLAEKLIDEKAAKPKRSRESVSEDLQRYLLELDKYETQLEAVISRLDALAQKMKRDKDPDTHAVGISLEEIVEQLDDVSADLVDINLE